MPGWADEPSIDVEASEDGFLVTARAGQLMLEPAEFAGLLFMLAGMIDHRSPPGVQGRAFRALEGIAWGDHVPNRADRRARRARGRV